jgi:hypothetical protein
MSTSAVKTIKEPHKSLLSNHGWLRVLLQHTREYLKQVVKAERARRDGKGKHPVSLPPHTYYATDVFDAVRPIFGTLDRLRWSVYFLETYPNSRSYTKKGITRDKWMEYHLANYVIEYTSCRDLCLLVINQVFRLGLKSQHCATDTVLQNEWVRSTDVPEAFKAVAKLASSHQERRNLHVHRGKVPDLAALTSEEAFPTLSTASFLETVDPGTLSLSDQRFIGYMYRRTAKELGARLREEIGQMDEALAALLTRLQTQYERKYEELTPIAAIAKATEHLAPQRKSDAPVA